MKRNNLRVWTRVFFAATLLLSSTMGEGFQWTPNVAAGSNGRGRLREDKSSMISKEGSNQDLMEIYPTGSTLPDCSHACGPCFPCQRVMVSFKCSIAESCPVVYRCMCRGRYYHVPSN